MREAREKLESEMEDAYHEHQANLLRQGKLRYGRPAILIICYICHSLDVGYPTVVSVMHCFHSDLLRRQEELRRMEEMHNQEMQKRKEMQLRYFMSLNCSWLLFGTGVEFS